ncbi:MAG: Gfo/Idh/MocA family oxidoreductase [Fimbriimonadaceae bacterium]|nr:Gfo/Idh/MocA family oxidoreductase [Fimbriimonadaceae bacterium]
MAKDAHTRRDVLGMAAAAAALTALPGFATAESIQPRRRRIGPNDTIQIGIIGPGGSRGGYRQGLGVGRWAHSKEGAKIVAVCDVDALHMKEASDAFGGARMFKDYREMIRSGGLDAVIIGTPDHWHHRQCLDAMAAGLDVYCEKPLTLKIAEGREIADSARRNRTVFQTGSQQRSEARFRQAVLVARSGRLGRITSAEVVLPGGPTGGPFETMPVPADFDWEMWQGPAERHEYTFKRTHGDFRWWREYSGGMLTDWGAHHLDILQWGLGMDDSGPISVEASCDSPPIISSRHFNTYPQFAATLEYPGGITVKLSSKGDNGTRFIGEKGWVFVNRGRIEASDPALLIDPPAVEGVVVSNDHVGNWLDAIRSRGTCICTAEIGHRSATVCHLVNESLDANGRKLIWDPRRERFG